MFASVAAFALLASASAVAPFHRGNGDVIPGEYMVVFQKDSAPADRDAHISKIKVCAHTCTTSFARHLSLLPDGRQHVDLVC